MIKTFRSSDRKGTEGIDFGEEWYKRLMTTLQSTSDVVCLFTERSVDRPWILFEAGVAKGKLNTPVIGVACGIPLSRVSAGPFYQFQNMDDSEVDLTKLIQQLARRIPALELDADVVKTQVANFRLAETEILKKVTPSVAKRDQKDAQDENSIAKLAEEMKALPSRVAERLASMDEPAYRRKKIRRIHPLMLDEFLHMAGPPGDPVSILMAASLVREEAPWLYELAMEVYRAVKSNDPSAIENELDRLKRYSEIVVRGPFMEMFGVGDRETNILLREFPRVLYRMLDRARNKDKPIMRERPTDEGQDN